MTVCMPPSFPRLQSDKRSTVFVCVQMLSKYNTSKMTVREILDSLNEVKALLTKGVCIYASLTCSL
jgi:hypothetical protein